MNFRRWPVRWRIAGISAALTLLILLCFALIVGRLTTNKIQSDFYDELQGTANRLAIQGGQADPLGFVRDAMMSGEGVVRLVNADGEPQLGMPEGFGPPEAEVTRVGKYEVASTPVSTNQFGETLFLQYGETRDSLDATIDRLWLLLALGVLGGAVLAFLAGLAVAGRAMRPISSLTVAAREIATTRDPSRRLPTPETDDEVGELARTLDQMLRELDAARGETEQMIQAQRDFVADASHELRTPLTSILANLELLEASLAERGASADEEEIVAGALGSSRRMRRLVSDLLLLARADAGRAGPRRRCDLAEIASTALAEVRPVAGDRELTLDARAPVPVHGNPDDLHRLTLNLLENAVSHTPAGTRVSVTIERRDGEAVLEVADNGPGIPDHLSEQLFSRFVRGDGPADLAVDSGTGLGLAIVKAVATSHGGDVALEPASAGGTHFVVRLPLHEGEETLTGEPAKASPDL